MGSRRRPSSGPHPEAGTLRGGWDWGRVQSCDDPDGAESQDDVWGARVCDVTAGPCGTTPGEDGLQLCPVWKPPGSRLLHALWALAAQELGEDLQECLEEFKNIVKTIGVSGGSSGGGGGGGVRPQRKR